MLNQNTRILNFDDSLLKQTLLIERFRPQILDLRDYANACRLWMSKNTKSKISSMLQRDSMNKPTFIGSGDFHHLSGLLIKQYEDPICVIIFDFHPDWDILPPRMACGSWVSSLLEAPNIKNIILLGVSSCDISTFKIQSANFNTLKHNRLMIYPYRHSHSFSFFKKVPKNISLESKGNFFARKICWHQLELDNLAEFTKNLMKNITPEKVYISIDKDCLKKEHSCTNWEEGFFKLEEIMIIIDQIRKQKELVGIDIAGDYSYPRLDSIIKRIVSRIDHPREYSAKEETQDTVNSINQSTNIKLLEFLFSG